MGTIIRRVLILAAFAALIILLAMKFGAADKGPGMTPEEMKASLTEHVNNYWNAKMTGDWLTVYEMLPPEERENQTLVEFMQGRNKSFYENYQLLNVEIDGLIGQVTGKYDWGVHVDVKIDLGEPVNRGVVITEAFRYDVNDKKWYKTEPKNAPRRGL